MPTQRVTNITLVPTAGLCNRISVIMNALLIARDHPNIHFDVRWYKNRELYADFEDLFMPISSQNFSLRKLTKLHQVPAKRRNFRLPALLQSLFYQKTYYDKDKTSTMTVEEIIGTYTNIYISKYTRFSLCPPVNHIAEIFVPTQEIELRIQQVTKQYTENTIGIHIRRSDNTHAIKQSPIVHFHKLIGKEIEKDPHCTFYLATDDMNVKEDFIKQYGERIITQSWEISRRSVQGMKDAVAELYCLGRCSKIIGSHHSTYSIFAAKLYDKELIL